MQGQARLLAQFDHGAARDALQHAAGGREHGAALDHEQVEPRALGHVAGAVAEHHGLPAALVGLEQAADEVAPVEVLDPGVHRLRRNALDLADDEVQTARALLLGGDPDERHGEGEEAVGARARVARAGGGNAARAAHLHVRLAQAAEAHALGQDLPHGFAGMRQRQVHGGGAALEALQVVLQPEELPAPDVHHVVGHVGAGEAPVRDRDAGLGDGHVGAVDERGAVCVAGLVGRGRRGHGAVSP